MVSGTHMPPAQVPLQQSVLLLHAWLSDVHGGRLQTPPMHELKQQSSLFMHAAPMFPHIGPPSDPPVPASSPPPPVPPLPPVLVLVCPPPLLVLSVQAQPCVMAAVIGTARKSATA